jgi:diguanylate cyclase (GGDEF)-like protein
VEGDECLKRVARALLAAARRPRDFVARYGGEEFVMLLPASDAQAARAVAERCRQEVFKAQIAHAASPLGQLLTMSVGAGTIIPAGHDDPVRFVEEVDRRLYRAKRQGRNRIVDAAA